MIIIKHMNCIDDKLVNNIQDIIIIVYNIRVLDFSFNLNSVRITNYYSNIKFILFINYY